VGKIDKLVIPKSLELEMIKFYHYPEHPGIVSQYRTMKAKFIFPDMQGKIVNFIHSCELCVATKTHKSPNLSKVKTTTPTHPWACVMVDLVGELPMTLSGNRYILTCVDVLTRWTELRAIPNKTAEVVTRSVMDIFTARGPPLTVQSDRGKEFTAKIFVDTLKTTGIHTQQGTPYTPTSQSIVERTNAKIKQKLRLFESENITWDEDLGFIQLTINLEHNRTLGMSPFKAFHGWSLCKPSFAPISSDESDFVANNWADIRSFKMMKCVGDLYSHLSVEKSESLTLDSLELGQEVLIYTEQPVGESAKFFQNWKGHFVIKKKVDHNVYIVHQINDPRKEYMVHRKRIRPLGVRNETIPKLPGPNPNPWDGGREHTRSNGPSCAPGFPRRSPSYNKKRKHNASRPNVGREFGGGWNAWSKGHRRTSKFPNEKLSIDAR
jgi:hypothetical protein